VIKMIEKTKTEVIYLRGNHDDFLDNVLPMTIGRLSIAKEYELISGGKKFWVIHGDIFDTITTNLGWLARLGDVGYTFLLWLNKVYNNYRIKKGLPFYSISKRIKQKVKTAVSFISDFENELVRLAKSRGYDGIICGHIHHPDISRHQDIIYMNSGDWVESLSALTEDYRGNWKIVYYADLVEEEESLRREKKNGIPQYTNGSVIRRKSPEYAQIKHQ